MRKHRKILGAVSAMAVLLSCMTAVLPLGAMAATEDDIHDAAKAYVEANQNETTKEGLLEAVRAVEPQATIKADEDFYIKYAVPGVTDDDTESGYPLNILGSDGAVAVRFTVGEQTIDFVTAFAHEKEVLAIENVAVAGESEQLVYEESTGNVIGYTEGAVIDKIVFPKSYTGTMGKVNFTAYPDMAKVKVVIFEDDRNAQNQKHYLPTDAFDANWTSLVALVYNPLIDYTWQPALIGHMPNNAVHDCPNLKYMRLPLAWNSDESAGTSKNIPGGIFSNLPKLENTNVPVGVWYLGKNFNNTNVREFIAGAQSRGGWKAFENPTACFKNDEGTGPSGRNITLHNTVPTDTQIIALAAAALNEQMNLGKDKEAILADAKAALVAGAWSAGSQTALQAVTLTADDDWSSGDAVDSGTFRITAGETAMVYNLVRAKALTALNVGYDMTPGFSPDTMEYAVTVPNNVEQLNINYVAAAGAEATITGNEGFEVGTENTVVIEVKTAENKTVTYTLKVTRSEDPFLIETNQVYVAAKAYVEANQNETTKEGLLEAVRAVEPQATIKADEDFYIKYAVPGVTDDDTESGYPLNILGSDGAVAVRFTVGEQTIDFVTAFAHEKEVLAIENVAVAGESEQLVYEESTGNVIGYTEGAVIDKIVFPKSYTGTMGKVNFTAYPDMAKVKVVIFEDDRNAQNQKHYLPTDAFDANWTSLVALVYNPLIDYTWQPALIGHMPNNAVHDCPNLKYMRLPLAWNSDESAGTSKNIPGGIFSNLPKLENTNVPVGVWYLGKNFNNTNVREFIAGAQSRGGWKAFENPTACFKNDEGTGPSGRNITLHNTVPTDTQIIALAAAALNEQMNLGKDKEAILADAKAALVAGAWSAGSQTALQAVTLEQKGDWEAGDIAVRGTFVITTANDSMDVILTRPHTLYALGVEGYTMTPAFSATTTEYAVDVPDIVTAVDIRYTAAAGATVKVTGNTELKTGLNNVVVSVETAEGKQVTYTIKVTRAASITLEQVAQMINEAAASFEATNSTTQRSFMTELQNAVLTTGCELKVEDFSIYRSIPGAEDDDGVIVPGHKGAVAAVITLTLGEESKTLAVTSDIEPEMKKYTFTKDEISTKEDFILSDDGKVLEWYVGDAKKIVIPDGVEVLEAGWFDGDLYNAQVLIIPDSVTEAVGNGMCRHMPHLEAVYIGDGMTEVPASAFQENYMLQYVRLSENTKVIGNQAFRKCLLLSSIYIPASVETFNTSSFDQAGVRDITFSGGVQSIFTSTIAYPARGATDNEWLKNDVSKMEGYENDPATVNQLMESFKNFNPNVVILNPDVNTENPFASNSTKVTGTIVQVHAPAALSDMDKHKDVQYYAYVERSMLSF